MCKPISGQDNPTIARFLSVDPLTKEYPWYTPYQFAGNTPISAIDLDGLEPSFPKGTKYYANGVRVSAEFVYEQRMDIYRQIMKDNYIHKVGESHVFDIDRAMAGARPVFESGNKELALKQFKEFREMATAALADYDTKLFQGQLKTLRTDEANRLSELKISIRNAKLRFEKSQEITSSEIVSLSLNGTGFVISGLLVETGFGALGLAITGDNFQKDLRTVMLKSMNQFKEDKVYTFGSELEKEFLGTDFIYEIAGIATSAGGGYTGTLKMLDEGGNLIRAIDVTINATNAANETKKLVQRKSD